MTSLQHVPFYSQRANWNGEDSGFPSQEAIDEWQPNCCGIACARMVIDHIGTFGVAGRSHRNKTVEELASVVRKGGHLVVVHSVSENGLVCHHPSSRVEGNHQNWDVPWSAWETSFSGNFMEFGRERL